jgi:hypothetical protein
MKHIGPVSWNIFEAVGLSIVAIENDAALKRAMRNSAWRNRKQSRMLAVHSYPQAPGRITRENAAAMAPEKGRCFIAGPTSADSSESRESALAQAEAGRDRYRVERARELHQSRAQLNANIPPNSPQKPPNS